MVMVYFDVGFDGGFPKKDEDGRNSDFTPPISIQ